VAGESKEEGMKYLIKPTQHGWYISINSTWNYWSVRSGWFTLLELLWCGEFWNYYTPRYFSITILGFELEVGKFKNRRKNATK